MEEEPEEIHEGFDEKFVEFWHSDENRPFMSIATDTLKIYESGRAEIYSRDYEYPIAVVCEWDFWKQRD